jgi:hypothetical protein
MPHFAFCARRKWTYVAGLLIPTLLFVLFLSLAPEVHQRIHSDAQQSRHECVVTLIAAGNCDHTASGPMLNSPIAQNQFSTLPALNSAWVVSLFLGARIFEHAPPA